MSDPNAIVNEVIRLVADLQSERVSLLERLVELRQTAHDAVVKCAKMEIRALAAEHQLTELRKKVQS